MKEYKVDQMENGKVFRLLAAITPGIVMSPASSILEASNAGHSNPEPIYKRWTRGLVPRVGREVTTRKIFLIAHQGDFWSWT